MQRTADQDAPRAATEGSRFRGTALPPHRICDR
jgi:hypothetical protein